MYQDQLKNIKIYLSTVYDRMERGLLPIGAYFDAELYEDYIEYCHFKNTETVDRRSFLRCLTLNGFKGIQKWNKKEQKPMNSREFSLVNLKSFLQEDKKEVPEKIEEAVVHQMFDIGDRKFNLTIKIRAV